MHDFVMTGEYDEPMNIPKLPMWDALLDRMGILPLKMTHTHTKYQQQQILLKKKKIKKKKK